MSCCHSQLHSWSFEERDYWSDKNHRFGEKFVTSNTNSNVSSTVYEIYVFSFTKKKILIIRIMIVIWVKGYMIRIAPWDKKGKRRAKGLYKIDNPRVVIL